MATGVGVSVLSKEFLEMVEDELTSLIDAAIDVADELIPKDGVPYGMVRKSPQQQMEELRELVSNIEGFADMVAADPQAAAEAVDQLERLERRYGGR